MLAQDDQFRPRHRLILIKLSEQPVGRRTIRAPLGCEQLHEHGDPSAAFVGSGGYRCRGVQHEQPGRHAEFSHGVLSNSCEVRQPSRNTPGKPPPLGNSELLSPKSRPPRSSRTVKYPNCMKIYFGFTVAGDRSALETARTLVQLLEGLGHEVLTRHLVSDDAWEKDRLISPQDVYWRDMAWLEQCEVLIAEVSGSSFGLGFETGYVLGATAKKVILFYRRDLEKKISLLITGNTHPNCTLAPYSNVTDVESFITSNLSGEPGAAELQASSNSGMF